MKKELAGAGLAVLILTQCNPLRQDSSVSASSIQTTKQEGIVYKTSVYLPHVGGTSFPSPIAYVENINSPQKVSNDEIVLFESKKLP